MIIKNKTNQQNSYYFFVNYYYYLSFCKDWLNTEETETILKTEFDRVLDLFSKRKVCLTLQ